MGFERLHWVSLQRDAGFHNIGFRSPHQSSKVALCSGELFFPLKARHDRVNATLEGVDPYGPTLGGADEAGGVGGRTATDSPIAVTPPDTAEPEPKAGLTGPDALGIYFDPEVGHYKLDKRGRRYPVDETGTRKFRFSGGRVTARPEGVSGELWSQMTMKEKTKALEELAKQTESALPGGSLAAEDDGGCTATVVPAAESSGAGGVGGRTATDDPASSSTDLPAILMPKTEGEEPWLSWDRSVAGCAVDVKTIPRRSKRTRPKWLRSPVPAMPTVQYRPKHRPRNVPPLFNAAVARPVTRKEIAATPEAARAMKIEWDRLRKKKVWDERVIREWADVARDARKNGTEVHMGYLFGICVEKNSELPLGHPSRKFKGRVVFQGNRVKNQDYQAAIFQDLGSAPATMAASRAADCFGCAPGNVIEVADGEQAYVQAELTGTPCWVSLPPEERPAAGKGFRNPVMQLKKALYGHPDSGTMWEEHCDKQLVAVDFQPIGPERHNLGYSLLSMSMISSWPVQRKLSRKAGN